MQQNTLLSDKKFLGGNFLHQQESNASPAPNPIVCPCMKILNKFDIGFQGCRGYEDSHGHGCVMGMGSVTVKPHLSQIISGGLEA